MLLRGSRTRSLSNYIEKFVSKKKLKKSILSRALVGVVAPARASAQGVMVVVVVQVTWRAGG